MKRWSGRTLAAAAAVLGFAASPVHADLLPSFSYTWDQSPTTLVSDGTGTGSISISVGSGTATAPTSIVAANLSVITSAKAPALDTYTNKAYQLTLALTDTASNQTGQFVFNGVLNGSANTTSSNFTNKYTGPTTLTEHLGNWDYSVHILDLVVPPISGGTTQGGISADVTASPFASGGTGGGTGGGTQTTTQATPEPSALLLAALGLPLAAGVRRLGGAASRRDRA